MKINNLSKDNSILNHFIAEIRSKEDQKDSLRFRKNIERIGEIMAYEISKSLIYHEAVDVTTPLGISKTQFIADKIVLATVLRAGLPFHQGFLNYFDKAENAFISACRKYKDELNFDVQVDYIASPLLDGKTVIFADPMLATGSSMELAYKALLTKGNPTTVHIACVIASEKAIDYIKKTFPANTTLWVAAIDPILNEHSYIIPGLGDAGDLAYGNKE
jgi:uracil phosphoribosyltransferase